MGGGFEYTQSKEMRRIAKRVDASLMEKKESVVYVFTEQDVNIYVEGGMCVCNAMQFNAEKWEDAGLCFCHRNI